MRCSCLVVVWLAIHSIVLAVVLVAGLLLHIDRHYGTAYAFLTSLPSAPRITRMPRCKPSTDNVQDLIVPYRNTTETKTPDAARRTADWLQDATDLVETHGMAILPGVFSPDTTKRLREYTVNQANPSMESVYVHEPHQRQHITLPHDEPIVHTALKEIAQHDFVRPLLEELLGPHSSLVTLAVITSRYGCSDQHWHADAEGTYEYPTKFPKVYALTVPLQDTTDDMGSTGVCPGIHKCLQAEYDEEYYRRLFDSDSELRQAHESDFNHWKKYHIPPCDDHHRASMQAGDGLLYSSDALHRGRAHTAKDAPDRAQFFMALVEAPQPGQKLPIGNFYALNWYMWGHTLDEFESMADKPWRWWNAFGIGVEGNRWTLFHEWLDVTIECYQGKGGPCTSLERRVPWLDGLSLVKTDNVLVLALTVTCLYLGMLTPFVMYLFASRARPSSK